MGVADDRMKSAAVLVESREESGLEEQSADVGELHDSRSLHCVASTDISNLPTAEGGRPSLPTVAETSAVSSEDTLQEMRQQLKELEKMWKASVNSQMAGFQRRNNEFEELNAILRRNVKIAEKVCKRTKEMMANLKEQGYLDILEAAPQPQKSPRRRRAGVNAGVSSKDTCTSDVSLVVELRRAVSSNNDIQGADATSAMSENTDQSLFATVPDSSSADVDKHDDLQYVWYEGALQNSGQRRSVAMDNGSDNTSLDSRSVNVDKHDDLQYVWYEGALQNSGQRRSVAMDNGSDNTSLDSRSVNVDKHDDLQYVWYEGALQNSGQRRSVAMDNGSDNTTPDSSSVDVDRHDDLQYVCYEAAMQNSDQRRSVAIDNGSDNTTPDSSSVDVDRHDDLQYVWYEGAMQNSGQHRSVAMDNGSDTTGLDAALSELTDMGDQHEESTVQENTAPTLKKKNRVQKLKRWFQRKGRKFVNKIRRR
ncbi:uncharacterized protein LOC118426853 [Branchiostoma floridae]|uniref:Uncharacterized protein LOC118426853 n=1 Tax=Branchiostoma floridae TaxID=7739 RepID=A0A9J7M0H0_BRAFL|nr:uncharacterized protein LOC118426853 [Branchiostoma floridae]XP_035692302.1 uncharacterized protein LOC118426853 [Branchiostoma floridae]XP_035692303.1 uncharacterized protein LOC118426853 [Branchiostoma floridae]